MYEFISGPLVLIAFIVFCLGILVQIGRFFLSTKQAETFKVPSTFVDNSRKGPPIWERPKKSYLKGTMLGDNLYMVIATSIFHICLLVAPIFLLAHNILLEQAWGISFPSLRESYTDILTMVIMGFGLFFLGRRLVLPRVRAITSGTDYFVLLVVFLPYVTGFIAYHQLFSYKFFLVLHILSGELMLVCLPFTKLVHLIYFFLNRFLLISEYSFIPGKRVWKGV